MICSLPILTAKPNGPQPIKCRLVSTGRRSWKLARIPDCAFALCTIRELQARGSALPSLINLCSPGIRNTRTACSYMRKSTSCQILQHRCMEPQLLPLPPEKLLELLLTLICITSVHGQVIGNPKQTTLPGISHTMPKPCAEFWRLIGACLKIAKFASSPCRWVGMPVRQATRKLRLPSGKQKREAYWL